MKTVAKEVKIIFEEKKSKFITYLKPVSTKTEAVEFVEYISALNRDATHNVYAYTVNDGTEHVKYSDDGEPKDTAGKPAYEILRMREIGNTALVISRYFGGIKLGAGGLIRAYAAAVKAALDESGVCEVVSMAEVVLDMPYNKADTVERIINEENGIINDREYSENVIFRVKITHECIEKIKSLGNIVVME